MLVLAALCLQAGYGIFIARVSAASLTATTVRLDRMKASTATTLRVVFTVPAGNSQTEEKLKISLPDNFVVNTTVANWSTDTASCGATALPGTFTKTASDTGGSKHLTLSGVTNLTASTSYCVDLTAGAGSPLTSTGSAGQYVATVETQTSGAATIDSTSVALRVITDDQIVVSAAVPPSFNFVLDANTTSFTANLDASNVRQTTERTATITTNAAGGWIAWAKDLNTGLTSAAASKTIASTTPGTGATLASGTEGYVLGVDKTDQAGGCTLTVTAAYQGTSANDNGSGLDTAYRQIANCATGTANGDVLKLYGKAAVSGTTPAATDYTDTWTVIGAATF